MKNPKEFEQEFQQYMNPPITQEPDRKKNQPLAMEIIGDQVRERSVLHEILNMVSDPSNDLDKLTRIKTEVYKIWGN